MDINTLTRNTLARLSPEYAFKQLAEIDKGFVQDMMTRQGEYDATIQAAQAVLSPVEYAYLVQTWAYTKNCLNGVPFDRKTAEAHLQEIEPSDIGAALVPLFELYYNRPDIIAMTDPLYRYAGLLDENGQPVSDFVERLTIGLEQVEG